MIRLIYKKAQGISLNAIIIAAIAMLVLVIVSIIFVGRMGKTRESVDSCEINGGSCLEECLESGGYPSKTSAYKCYYNKGEVIPEGKKVGDVNENLKCCIKI